MADHAIAAGEVPHAHQFDDAEQQTEAVALGMWAFLATEVLFFGALFAAYAIYRGKYPDVYHQASHHLDFNIGFINTLVLLVSSLTMAMAVHAAQEGKKKLIIVFLVATIICAFVFLGLKTIEYEHKFHDALIPGWSNFDMVADGGKGVFTDKARAQIFMALYFCMTGLHAIHIIIGIGALAVLVFLANRDWFSPHYNSPVEMVGLYWHFVDVVWVFLFPLLYLIS